MIARPAKIRELLRRSGASGQVSEEAVVAFVAALEDVAAAIAEGAVRGLAIANEARAVQRLEPLRRLTDEHVREGIRRSHGNS